MALYKSTGTKNSSGQDVQEPHTPYNPRKIGVATVPPQNIIQKRPNYIIVNGGNATTYNFLYETTCSVGGTTGETHIAGFDFASTTQIPTRLDINPVSWNGGGGAAGEITFVYKGKK